MKRAVFLDRDGVINKAFVVDGIPTPARSLDQLQILPRVLEALEILRDLEFEIVVVTNQPDIARGALSQMNVDSLHRRLKQVLGIQHFYTCSHDDADGCPCRKPKSGLLIQAATDLNLDLEQSLMVGDRWRDISAGQSVGCRCFFVDYSYDEKQPLRPFFKVSSLYEVAKIITEEIRDLIKR
jgi:D-glycero-D-manno-heptose 1,7-bisphosphate phosphatase